MFLRCIYRNDPNITYNKVYDVKHNYKDNGLYSLVDDFGQRVDKYTWKFNFIDLSFEDFIFYDTCNY